jgi:hypothetical protein
LLNPAHPEAASIRAPHPKKRSGRVFEAVEKPFLLGVEEAYTHQGRAHIRRLHPDWAAPPALMSRAAHAVESKAVVRIEVAVSPRPCLGCAVELVFFCPQTMSCAGQRPVVIARPELLRAPRPRHETRGDRARAHQYGWWQHDLRRAEANGYADYQTAALQLGNFAPKSVLGAHVTRLLVENETDPGLRGTI